MNFFYKYSSENLTEIRESLMALILKDMRIHWPYKLKFVSGEVMTAGEKMSSKNTNTVWGSSF